MHRQNVVPVERQHTMQQVRPSLVLKGRPLVAALGLALLMGCSGTETEHPALYDYGATPDTPNSVDRCSQSNTGCPCENPGEIIDCGKISLKVDGYETCYAASRLCSDDKTLGPCVPDQTIVAMSKAQ